jgi:hypothetical protein
MSLLIPIFKFVRHHLPYASVPVLLAAVGGCALAPKVPVAAFEKGDLARPAMQFDADRLDAAFNDHIYFSKEGASGGRSVGGGGCGCN